MGNLLKGIVLFFFTGTAFLLSESLQAQELNARVRVDDAQVQTTERRVFREMETEFARFLNERKWTSLDLAYNEKINCNVQITLNPTDRIGVYSATLIIQAARPVYNSSYTTPTFFFRDNDFAFEYIESQPLDFNVNNFNSNLTSVLAYYAYMVIGMDFDSFERLGGSPYFEVARNIVQVARQGGFAGWDASVGGNSSRNRGALVNDLMNTQLLPLRNIMYDYHRLGLDTFIEDPEESRKTIFAGLQKLEGVRSYNPGSILLVSFFDAKDDELAKIFSEGDIAVRRQAYELLSRVDPGNAEKYRKMVN